MNPNHPHGTQVRKTCQNPINICRSAYKYLLLRLQEFLLSDRIKHEIEFEENIELIKSLIDNFLLCEDFIGKG